MLPFVFEQVEEKSSSSIFWLHFILQKNERLTPEQSFVKPDLTSVFTKIPPEKQKLEKVTVKMAACKVRHSCIVLYNTKKAHSSTYLY